MRACIRARAAGSNIPNGLAAAPAPAPAPAGGTGGKRDAKGFGAGWVPVAEVGDVLLVWEAGDVGPVDGSPGAGNDVPPAAPGNPPNGLAAAPAPPTPCNADAIWSIERRASGFDLHNTRQM